MKNIQLPRALSATAIGVHQDTLSRWQRRQRLGLPLALRRGPRRLAVSADMKQRAADLVRELHGLVGADSLRCSVPGLSRRAAAVIKADICSQMERERRTRAERIQVTAPGILRGFDAMYVSCQRGQAFLLAFADGSVPYRTSCWISPRYDDQAVASAMVDDFEANGAPLVLRMDRARQHATKEVRDILDAHGVLVLNGPPHRAQYYGQLERQNREHRAWLDVVELQGEDDLASQAATMISALNTRWRRRTLGWKTAAEVWASRPKLNVDRHVFREEVLDRTERLRRVIDGPADLAERLAIEQALEHNGCLRREIGGWC